MTLQLKRKIELKTKGESTRLTGNSLVATLSWHKAIDLDLHAFYLTNSGDEGRCYFANLTGPHIRLSGDEGIGDVGGDNVEVLKVDKVDNFKEILVAVNVFGKSNAVFADYDGKITVKCGTDEITVPLISKEKGSWCTVAKLVMDNDGNIPRLSNVNHVTNKRPKMENRATKGFMGFMRNLVGGN